MSPSRIPAQPMPFREQIAVVHRALRGLSFPEHRDHAFGLLYRVTLAETWDERLRGWAANAIRRA
jgi:hypothetical protein